MQKVEELEKDRKNNILEKAQEKMMVIQVNEEFRDSEF